jgi:hypothetical protein
MAVLISASQIPDRWRPEVQAAIRDWRTRVLAIARQRQLQANASASRSQRQPVVRPEPRHRPAHAARGLAPPRAASWYLDSPPTPSWRL